jgi:hypothetical protein
MIHPFLSSVSDLALALSRCDAGFSFTYGKLWVPFRLHDARTIKAGVKIYQYTPITSTYRDERNGSPCLKAFCLQRSITKNRKYGCE